MIIGVSLRRFKDGEKYKYYINQSYLDYLKGYDILLLNNENLNLLKMCDCFLLTGGYDLDPKLYNETNICSDNVDDYLDTLDFNIIQYCVNNNKKLLGICRGMQSINVYFKGSLKQEVKNHMNCKHDLAIIGSRYLKDGIYNVNSYHHQCINKLGDNLVSTGISDDGVIEMIEHEKCDILGVQFHPELLSDLFNIKKLIGFFF